MNIVKKHTPNCWKGRDGQKPEAIVIHIMAGTLKGTDSWFATTDSEVSAHYGVGKNGEVHQYVEEQDTAWHAGAAYKPSWSLIKPKVNPNSYTIGIEHEGQSADEWTPEMKAASAELIRGICSRWNIPIDREHIIGHYEIYSKKPNCPAVDKSIITELIKLSTPPVVEPHTTAQADIMETVPVGTQSMNYSLLKSRTVWTVAAMFLIGGVQAVSAFIPESILPFIQAGLSLMAMYFHVNPSQNYPTAK